MHIQARHQLHAMIFDGLGTDLQDSGDLLGVSTFGNELEYLPLAARQMFELDCSVGDLIQRNFFEELPGYFLNQIHILLNHMLQSGLGLLRACLRGFGARFSLLNPRLVGGQFLMLPIFFIRPGREGKLVMDFVGSFYSV
jgi:hypothetical protein